MAGGESLHGVRRTALGWLRHFMFELLTSIGTLSSVSQGLGPRRLDTAERIKLIDETVLFFDATSSSAAQTRRAASVGPGTATLARDSSITPEASASESRASLISGAVRSMSMMPSTRPQSSQQETAPSFSQPTRLESTTGQEVLMNQTGAPLTETPPPIEPPVYSPVTASAMAGSSGATAVVADVPASPGAEVATPPMPELPPQASASSSATPSHHHPQRPRVMTDSSRGPPHEHFQNRAAELRAEAATMSPPSSPLAELSPAASRASSLYDRAVTTASAVTGSSTDNSRPPSVISSAETPETPAANSSFLRQSDSSIVETPSSIESPLEQVETNASRLSVSSSSDVDHHGSFDEQRGRSAMPVQRGREREDLTYQTIAEDGPQEALLDTSHGPASGMGASAETSTRRPSSSSATLQSADISARSTSNSRAYTDSSQSLVAPNAPVQNGTSSASSGRRSSSVASNHTLSSHTPKSARFSLSNLIHRDKSSSRTRRSASPDSMLHSKRAHSTSRTRGNSLQVIKHALAGALHDKDSHLNSTQVTHTPISSEAESDSEDEHGRGRARSSSRSSKWQEFKPGSYHFPIYFPVPLSLPPTIHANHGQVTYMLKAFVNRAGALTTNLHTVTEVHVVAAPNEDDLEAIESIIVERMWETQLNYKIVIHCKVSLSECFKLTSHS